MQPSANLRAVGFSDTELQGEQRNQLLLGLPFTDFKRQTQERNSALKLFTMITYLV